MNKLTNYLVSSLLHEDKQKYKEIIALFPGGFKIPQLAHFHIADEVSKRTEITKLKILIGHKERDGITKEQSLAIWNIYKNHLNNKVEPEISSQTSPVKEVLDIVKNNPKNFYILVFGRNEDADRFKNVEQYDNVKIINFKDFEIGVSGTKARLEIVNGNYEGLQRYLPTELTDEEREKIWNILTNKINELEQHELKYWATYADIYDALKKDPEKRYEFLKTKLQGERLKALEYFYNEYFKEGQSVLNENLDNKEHLLLIKKLVDQCCSELEIPKPNIIIVGGKYTEQNKSFGGYVPSENKIYLVVKGRNLADSCRTLSHELKHAQQNHLGQLTAEAGKDGDKFENEANSFSGETMRKFGRENPQIFKIKL